MFVVDVNPEYVYLATYFLGNGEAGMYFAVSDDGYRFQPIVEPNVAVVRPQIGRDKLMRDPCLTQGPDGRWHLVWTTGWWDRIVGVASAPNLTDWGEQVAVPAMIAYPDAVNAWAPEITWDDETGEFVIFWSSTIRGKFEGTKHLDGDRAPDNTVLNHRFYATRSRDLRTFGATRLLWDPGFNCIDATLLRQDGRWLMFAKDETKAPTPAKFLFSAQARSLQGPWEVLARRITGDYWAEGPTATLADGVMRVYFDRYTQGRWGAVESRDGVEWKDVSDLVRMPAGAHHGTVLRVEKALVEQARVELARRGVDEHRLHQVDAKDHAR
jgi:hypothetical protein